MSNWRWMRSIPRQRRWERWVKREKGRLRTSGLRARNGLFVRELKVQARSLCGLGASHHLLLFVEEQRAELIGVKKNWGGRWRRTADDGGEVDDQACIGTENRASRWRLGMVGRGSRRVKVEGRGG